MYSANETRGIAQYAVHGQGIAVIEADCDKEVHKCSRRARGKLVSDSTGLVEVHADK